MSTNTYLPPSPVLPGSQIITAVTNSNPMIVTVSSAVSYVPGQVVNFSIPNSYGMFQLNGRIGQILSIDGLDFTININSTQFDPFVIPSSTQPKPAMLTPGGSRNLYNFQQVPFRSEGNFGN